MDVSKPPVPPSCRLVCLACGDITRTGKHTHLLCRLVAWLKR